MAYLLSEKGDKTMRKTRSWKHVNKNRKQYGKRNMTKYMSPFMVLDEVYFGREVESIRG